MTIPTCPPPLLRGARKVVMELQAEAINRGEAAIRVIDEDGGPTELNRAMAEDAVRCADIANALHGEWFT